MVSNFKICLERADNELYLAGSIQILSDNSKLKKEYFNLEESITFYSAVISHAYYAIFYSAKAYLISKGIDIPEQGQHQHVYFKIGFNTPCSWHPSNFKPKNPTGFLGPENPRFSRRLKLPD